jgi:hypothetical protein
MKNIIFKIMLMMMPLLSLTSCHEESDDYYATAVVNIMAAEDITIEKIQGTVKLTNLNNGEVYSTADFDNARVMINVLRGSYAVYAQGTVKYRDAEGNEMTANFRASADYAEVMNHPSEVNLKMLFM